MAKAYRQSNKYTYSNGQSLPLKAEKEVYSEHITASAGLWTG